MNLLGRSQGPEIRAAENSDRGKGSESSRSDKGQRSEDKSHNKN